MPDRFVMPKAADVATLALTPFFSSDTVGPDAYESWKDTGGDISTIFESTPGEPFSCSSAWLGLGQVRLGYAEFSAAQWLRTKRMIARDDYDQLIVNFRFRGAVAGDLNGRTIDAPNGSIILNDLAAPQLHYSQASDSASLVLERAEAETLLGPVRALHGHVVPPRLAGLVLSHIDAVRRHAHQIPASNGDTLGSIVMDLVAMAIKTSRGEELEGTPLSDRVLAIRLREMIDRDLGSPTLNVARLSRQLGVSRSTLYRLMRDEGGVQAYIRSSRLKRVADTLRNPSSEKTLEKLAEQWGFCDAAYLGRSFRETYGVTPGDYREAHRRR